MQITIEITPDTLDNLLCSAFEGGIAYWAGVLREINPGARWRHEYPLKGGSVTLYALDDTLRKPLTLDAGALQRGLDCMPTVAPRAFADVITGNIDAQTGDAFVQCCVFGRLVYG